MTNKRTLWIVGDSYSQPRQTVDTPLIWPELVAEHFGCDQTNASYHGVGQDYCWHNLQAWHRMNMIKPDDLVLVVLTHPNRTWYFQDLPDLSNGHWLIDLDSYVTPAQAQAVKNYIEHIQRPELDTVNQAARMGWLAYMSLSMNMDTKPMVLQGFNFDLYDAADYKGLNVASGSLFNVQNNEFAQEHRENGMASYFYGADARYNHLSMINHRVLADKIIAGFENNSQVDLTSGFFDTTLPIGSIETDPEWCEHNLNPVLFEHYKNVKAKVTSGTRRVTSWLSRAVSK